MLLTLAEDVPSIGEVHDKHKAIYYIADYFILHVDIFVLVYTATKVKSKEITSRNIQKYVPIIVQNKAFLMINPERER